MKGSRLTDEQLWYAPRHNGARLAAIMSAATLALAGCGGGGGGGGGAPPPPSFSLGGSVQGLQGGSVTLTDTAAGSSVISKDGAFTLPRTVQDGSAYSVTVSDQPNPPSQTCSVGGGTGTVRGAAVNSIAVTCVVNTYTVGGTVSGIGASGLTLQLNGGSALAVSGSGPFTFPSALASGAAYAVTIASVPKDWLCSIQKAAGTIGGVAITDVAVSCAADRTTYSYTVSGITADDVVWDAGSQRLYLAMSSQSSVGPNSIVEFDPIAGSIATPVYAGSEPASISLSDDGASLYVGFRGAAKAVRLSLPALTTDFTVSQVDFAAGGALYSGSPAFPLQVAAAPGTTGTFALLSVSTQTLIPNGYILVYDTTTPRWLWGVNGNNLPPAASAFRWGSDASVIYAFYTFARSSGPDLHTYAISPQGWQETSYVPQLPVVPGSFTIAADRLYADAAKVFDLSGTLLGTYEGLGPLQSQYAPGDLVTVPDVVNGRAFVAATDSLSDLVIKSFDLTSYAAIASAPISAIPGKPKPKKIIRWGRDGLAVLMRDGHLVVLSGPFVAPGGAPVVGTIPGSELGVAVTNVSHNISSTSGNDVAWDPVHNAVYASIPATATTRPRSIATLDPNTLKAVAFTDLTINPGVLTVSADGQYLYVAAADSGIVQRWRLPAMTLDLTIPLGTSSPEYAWDVVVSPTASRTIAVAQQNPAFTPNTGPIQVYDDAVARTSSFPTQGDWVEWDSTGTSLYTFENQSSGFAMREYEVGNGDIRLANATPMCLSIYFNFPWNSKFKSAGGLVYGDTGVVWNPTERSVIGTYLPTTPSPVAVDLARGRVYFATPGHIQAFNRATFTPAMYGIISTTNVVTRFLQTGPSSFLLRTSAGEIVSVSDPNLAR